MINITIRAPRVFTPMEANIMAVAFEKMSQLATMYEEDGVDKPMMDCVRIKRNDIQIISLNEDRLMECECDISDEEFLNAIRMALHTKVEFSINTKEGTASITRPLFPCVITDNSYVAWLSEPDFTLHLDENDRIFFHYFDGLKRFVDMDVDGVETITMIAGGEEVWSM